MENIRRNDSETEYRNHLRVMEQSDPVGFAQLMARRSGLAKEGNRSKGRGVVVAIDDGRNGCDVYVPREQADMQFGAEVHRVCQSYDVDTQWILVGITDGRLFPIVMNH